MGVTRRSPRSVAGASLAVASLIVAALLWSAVFYPPVYTAGIVVPASERNSRWARVIASAPAARASGVFPGDEIHLAAMSFPERVRWVWGAPRNHVFNLRVRDAAGVRIVPVRASMKASRPPVHPEDWAQLLVTTLAVLVAGFLAFRRPSLMTGALLWYECGALNVLAFARAVTSLPDAIFTPLVMAAIALFGSFPNAVLAAFAARFPYERPTGWRRRFVRIVDAFVVAAFVAEVISISVSSGLTLSSVLIAIYALAVLCVSTISLLRAAPMERGRISVVFAGIMCSSVAYSAVFLLWVANGQRGTAALTWGILLSQAILPAAVAYAILRHRVIDIAFVVNRTLVYAVTSAIVVVVLAALELLAERYASARSHVANTAVEFAIVLLVALCIRFVHTRVDRAVDNLFFRTRHEQECALVRFATTAQFYTDPGPLMRDGIDAVVRFGCVNGAAVYLSVPGGATCSVSTFSPSPPFVEENDAAFVELRAHGQALDARGRRTVLPGTRFYPMTLAGRLLGVLATGERHSGEEMPPDIDAALRGVATSIGFTLEAIETTRLRAENSMLRARLNIAPT